MNMVITCTVYGICLYVTKFHLTAMFRGVLMNLHGLAYSVAGLVMWG